MATKVKQLPQTASTSVVRDEAQQPYLHDVWGKGLDLFNQRPDMSGTAGNYYQASDAYNNAASSPLLGQAQNYFSSVARGDYLNPTSNPYFQGMVDQTIAAARPSVDTAFASSGRLGSGAHAAAFSDAALRASTGLGYQNYQTERGYQDQAAGMLPQMAALPAGFLQQGADLRNQGSTLQSNVDFAALQNYKNVLGDPMISGQNSVGTQPYVYNPTLQGIGAASQLIGAFGSLTGGKTGSDIRSKEDIRPVGRLNNGLPIYSYRYKGDNRTQIGLLAQEVAQVKPHAVGDMGDGLLGVDYAEASR
jgi:hypothetical protein